jgi:hypothetical protein
MFFLCHVFFFHISGFQIEMFFFFLPLAVELGGGRLRQTRQKDDRAGEVLCQILNYAFGKFL